MAERKNSAARIRANNKYNEKAYDRINIAIPKGNKAKIQEHATIMNESTNAFVIRAIKETMERDKLTRTLETAISPSAIDKATKRDKPINGLNAPAAPPAEATTIKQQAAEPEQTATPLPESEPDKHCKPLTEDAENNVNLVKLLADVNYQLDIEEAYGFETLRALLDKARQQESEREEAAEENTTPMSDLNKSDT